MSRYQSSFAISFSQLTNTPLRTTVHKTTAPSVGPVDAADLAALLAQIPSDRERSTTTHYPSPSRSSTAEPPEDTTQAYETKCYQALLSHGFRPLFPISLLPQVSTNAEAYRDLLRPWTRYPDTSDPEDCHVFSRQLDRCKQFCAWQLRNRGQTLSFSQYLDEHRRDFVMMGGKPERTTRPDFEQAARRLWEREYDHGQPQLEGDNHRQGAVFSRYAEAARTLLMDHGFVQPFQLLADPKQQDQWTTYVEYLAFECSSLGSLTMAAQKLQQPPSDTQKYKKAKAEADHQQRRVDWVRSEIGKIEVEQNAAAKNGTSVGTGRRKRKLTDDTDAEPLVRKRSRTDETGKVAAGGSDNSRTTRSRKYKLQELQLETQKLADESDGPRTRSKKRQEGIHKKSGNASLSTALQPGLGTAVVSAVTTTRSRPRQEPNHERLKSLRPRADGRVTGVGGLKTRGGEAARKPRGRPGSNHGVSKVT